MYEKKGAVLGLHQLVDFESDTITLDIPMKGISISGWTITPLIRPVVSFLYHTISTHNASSPLATLGDEETGGQL